MNQIYNAIENYINSNGRYALQVDGHWGSGKTYFIKNIVEKKLYDDKSKFIYFSLYGYDSLVELKKELMLTIASNIKYAKSIKGLNLISKSRQLSEDNLTLNSITLVSNIILSQLQKATLKNTDKKIVIVIDDLERCSKNINISDLFGFISTELLEKLSFKVLVISNSNEIEEKNYRKIKEKVIGRTITFSHDKSMIGDILLNKSESSFIKKKIDWILDILTVTYSDFALLNLRTLFSIIDNYEFIEDKFKKQISELPFEKQNKIKESLFLNVFVLTNEYKLGKISLKDLPELKEIDYKRSFWIFDTPNPDKLEDRLHITYHGINQHFDSSILYAFVIANYVLCGIWEDDNYVAKWIETFFPIEVNESFEELRNFRRLTDEEIEGLQRKVVHDVVEKNYSHKELISIYILLTQFKNIELLFIEDSNLLIIEQKIIDSIDRVADQNVILERIEDEIRFSGIRETEFGKRIETTIQSFRDKNLAKKNLRLITAIFQDDRQAIENIKNYTSSPEIQIFKYILENNHMESFLICKKNKADLLNSYINSNYLRISNSRDYHHTEIPDIIDLRESIEQRVSELKLDKVDLYKINQLLRTLSKLEEHLKL